MSVKQEVKQDQQKTKKEQTKRSPQKNRAPQGYVPMLPHSSGQEGRDNSIQSGAQRQQFNGNAVVNTRYGLRLRENASLHARILRVVPFATRVKVLERIGKGPLMWAKVETKDGEEGFMSMKYLSLHTKSALPRKAAPKDKEPQSSHETASQQGASQAKAQGEHQTANDAASSGADQMILKFKSASLRAKPTTKSKRVAMLKSKDVLTVKETVTGQVIRKNKHWLHVKTDSGLEGYIAASLVVPNWHQKSDKLLKDKTKLDYPDKGTFTVDKGLPKSIQAHYNGNRKILGPWVVEFANEEKLAGKDGSVTVNKEFITKLKAFQKKHHLLSNGKMDKKVISVLVRNKKGNKDTNDKMREAAFDITAHNETRGSYSTWQCYDRGLLSYGFIQFTIAAKSLKSVMKHYVDNKGKEAAKMQAYLKEYDTLLSSFKTYYTKALADTNKYLKKLGKKPGVYVRGYYGKDKKFHKGSKSALKYYCPKCYKFAKFLEGLGNETAMIEAEKETATHNYYNSAVGLAAEYGLKSSLGISFMFDASVQHGPGGAARLAKRAKARSVKINKNLTIPAGKVGDVAANKTVITEPMFIAKMAHLRISSATRERSQWFLDQAVAQINAQKNTKKKSSE